jgi:hypothetical protein
MAPPQVDNYQVLAARQTAPAVVFTPSAAATGFGQPLVLHTGLTAQEVVTIVRNPHGPGDSAAELLYYQVEWAIALQGIRGQVGR